MVRFNKIPVVFQGEYVPITNDELACLKTSIDVKHRNNVTKKFIIYTQKDKILDQDDSKVLSQ